MASDGGSRVLCRRRRQPPIHQHLFEPRFIVTMVILIVCLPALCFKEANAVVTIVSSVVAYWFGARSESGVRRTRRGQGDGRDRCRLGR